MQDSTAEQMLRTKEEQLAEAQRLAHLGSWEWDIPSNTVTWSDELYRIYGLQPQEFEATYKGFLDRIHPDDLELVKGEVERAYREGTSFSFEHRIVQPDGTVRWLVGRGATAVNKAGAPVKMFGTAQDMTEQKQAAAERQQLIEENQLVAEVGQIISSSLNIEEVYERFAQELKKLVGFERVNINIIDHEADMFIPKYQSGVRYRERAIDVPVPLKGTMVDRVVETGQSLVREDLGSGNLFDGDSVRLKFGIRSSIVMPMIVKGRVIGTFGLHSQRVGAYRAREQAILERLARQIAPAVENALLYERTRKAEEALRQAHEELEIRVEERTSQLETTNQTLQQEIAERSRLARETEVLAEIGKIICSSLDIGEVYDRFAREVGKLIPFDRIIIAVADLAHDCFSDAYIAGLDVPGREQGTVRPVDGSFTGAVLRSASTIFAGQEGLEELAAHFPGLKPLISIGLRSFLSVPLMSEGKPIGALTLSSTKEAAYSEKDAVLGERIGAQIAGAIANAQLHTQVKQAEQTIREMSTPVLPIQERLLLVPLIGVVYPQRAAQLTDHLLNAIRSHRARAVVIDITGVVFLDTYIANHLIKTVEAARLLGTAIIVTGISTDVAQTLVRLGVDLSQLHTVADLQSGIGEAKRLLSGSSVA